MDDTSLYEKQLRVYDLEEVQRHTTEDDCWVVHGKHIYDITNFLEKHPGGADLILHEAGTDVTGLLRDENLHIHTANAYTILKEYKIGEIRIDNRYVDTDESHDINENNLFGFKEDLVDWNRGMVMQVHKFGRDYIKWVHTPVNKKMRMFDNPFIEFLTNTYWYVIPIIWIPVLVSFGVVGYMKLSEKMIIEDDSKRTSLPNYNYDLLLAVGISFITGLFLWTFLEYMLHRYVFHLEPNGDSPLQITLHFTIHGMHHKVPFDEGRLVFPPVLSLAMATILWFFISFMPDGIDALMFSGGITGYTCYDLIHYYVHHGNPSKGSYLHGMKHYHVRHHFVDANEGYGISSKFWDTVFNIGKRKFL